MPKKPDTYDDTLFRYEINEAASIQAKAALLHSEMYAEIQTIQRRFAPRLEALDAKQKPLLARLAKYARKHRARLFPADAKSAETGLARYGFRIDPPSLKTLKGWTWDKVVAALKFAKRPELVRIVEEVDKLAMKNLPEAELERFGCTLKAKEKFFIEPKAEAPEGIKEGQ